MKFGEGITSMTYKLSKKGFFEIRPLRGSKCVFTDYEISLTDDKISTSFSLIKILNKNIKKLISVFYEIRPLRG